MHAARPSPLAGNMIAPTVSSCRLAFRDGRRNMLKPKRKHEPEEPVERHGPRRLEPDDRGSRRTETTGGRPWRPSRRLLWIAGIAAILLVTFAFVARHFDEWLRRTLESRINERLQGYTVRLAEAHFEPMGLAVSLGGIVLTQDAHPDPPVADIERLRASVEWRQLLKLNLVANARFDRPRIHVNLAQLRKENRDEVDVEDRGWQDALQSIYPLEFNLIEVRNGDIIYIDQDPERPLHISQWNLTAAEIRTRRADNELIYPSPVHADAVIFEKGRAVVDGHADFLAKPYPGVHAVYTVEEVPLDRLGVLGERANLDVDGGVLASKGEFELGSKHQEVRIDDITVSGLKLDYVHTAATSPAEEERAEQVAEVAADQTPVVPVEIVRARLTGSELGLVDRSQEVPYRVFLDQATLEMTNLSRGFVKGPAKASLTGRFQGSGAARANGTFRPEKDGPDFDLAVTIEGASLPAMNDLLRAYGKLDVAGGTFSLYSEMHVGEGRIDGYVKPLFADIDVYDREQDKDKPVLKKIYEKVAGAVSHLLENQPRDEVVTVAEISGPLENPDSSLWEIVVRLLRNAFVDAILPGFDREFENAERNRGRDKD